MPCRVWPSGLETLDRIDDVNLLRFGQLRIAGNANVSRAAFPLREIASFVTEIRKTFLPVKRNRIINFVPTPCVFNAPSARRDYAEHESRTDERCDGHRALH